jgi:diguanylate cyclase (GGDEF)-like protein
MAMKNFKSNLEKFFESMTSHLKDELNTLEKEYEKTNRRLEKVLKQSDSQQKQLITLHKKLQNAYVELDEYRMNLEEKVNEKVKELLEAKHDPLTKLPNRGMFNELLPKTLKEAEEREENLALMFIDLDKFKQINDTMGHDAGDEILVQASERLKGVVSEKDIVARLGGDEFTIIFPDIKSREHVTSVASKIVEDMQKDFQLSAGVGNIGASIGISFFPDDADSVTTLLKSSDIAMYYAKEKGRGRYQIYSEVDDI